MCPKFGGNLRRMRNYDISGVGAPALGLAISGVVQRPRARCPGRGRQDLFLKALSQTRGCDGLWTFRKE